MVEGPGATKNAKKVKAGIIGYYVTLPPLDIGGSSGGPQQQQQQLKRMQLVDVFSVGKEVFLIFVHPNNNNNKDSSSNGSSHDGIEECALRLHFGMNGSLIIESNNNNNKVRTPSSTSIYTASWKKPVESISLQLTLQSTPATTTTTTNQKTLFCYNTTVSFVSTRIARSKFQRLHHHDICSSVETFDKLRIVQKIFEKRQSTSMICDIVLDQELLPGIGNIIKIEGLHIAKIHPKRMLQSLTQIELLHVIDSCRSYAMQWLQYGKSPYHNVYNQTICQTCQNNTVRIVKLGNDYLSRVTFWCTTCQPFLSEVVARNNDSNNNGGSSTTQHHHHPTTLSQPTLLSSSSHPRNENDNNNEITSNNNKRNAFTILMAQPPPQHPSHQDTNHITTITNNNKRVRTEGRPKQLLLPTTSSQSTSMPSSLSSSSTTTTTKSLPRVVISCPKHGGHTIQVKRVRKSTSANRYRLFATCRLCPTFFLWVDNHFPNCPTCHKKSILRISKTEHSGGRWFLSCGGNGNGNRGTPPPPPPKNYHHNQTTTKMISSCCQSSSFFTWATPQHLAPLQPFLKPLL